MSVVMKAVQSGLSYSRRTQTWRCNNKQEAYISNLFLLVPCCQPFERFYGREEPKRAIEHLLFVPPPLLLHDNLTHGGVMQQRAELCDTADSKTSPTTVQ